MAGRGEARFRVTLDGSGFESVAASLEKQWRQFTESIAKGAGIGVGFSVGQKAAETLVEAVKAIPAAAIDAVKHLEEVAHSIEGLHAKTGLGTTAAQELSVAMRISGGDSEALGGLITKLQKKLVEGSSAFAGMGLSAKKLKQEDIGTAFTEVAEKIRGMQNPTEQTAAMLAVFGKSGAEAARLIKRGVEELTADAHHLGAVLDKETVEAAGHLGEEGRRASIAWEALKNNLAAAVVEDKSVQDGLHNIAEGLATLARKAHDGKEDLQAYLDVLKNVASMGGGGTASKVAGAAGGYLGALGSAVPNFATMGLYGVFKDEAQAQLALKVQEELARKQNAKATFMGPGVRESIGEGAGGAGGFDVDGHAASEKKEMAGLQAELSALQAKHHGVYASMMGQIEAATAKRIAEAHASKAYSAEALPEIEKGIRAIGQVQLELANHDFVKSLFGSAAGDTLNQLNDLGKGVELAGGVAEMSWPQLQKLADSLTAIGLAGQSSALGIAAADEQLSRLNAAKDILIARGGLHGDLPAAPGLAQNIDFSKQSSDPFMQAFGSKRGEAEFDQRSAGMEYWSRYKDVAEEIARENKKLADSDPSEHFKQVTEAVRAAAAAMAQFASLTHGALGVVAGLGAGALAVMDGLKNRVKNMSGAQKVQAGAQAAMAAMSIYEQAKQDPNAGHRTLGGMEVGAAAGSSFGPLGAAIGGAFGAAISFFSGPKWAETAKTAGKVLGGAVSNELAKAIHDTKFKYGVSGENASLLHLGDFMRETGKGATDVQPQIKALMDAITSGAVPAKQGLEQLDAVFPDLVKSAGEGDVAAQKLTASLIQQGMAAGKLTDSMRAYAEQALGSMAGGADKILQGLSLIGKKTPLGDFGTAAAQDFVAGFTAELGQKGIVQALTDSGAGITDFYQRLMDEGNTAAAAMLAPWVQLANVINDQTDPSVKGFLITLQGMSEVMGGLDKIGFVTKGAFQGLETGIQGTVNALSEAGVTGPAALQAIAPELGQVIAMHEKYGFVIDKATQDLIDQAKVAGIAFPTDPLQSVVTLLEQIVTLMGGIPKTIDTTLSVHTNGTLPNGEGGTTELPGHAAGGYFNKPHIAAIAEHGPEFVVPAGQARGFARAVLGAGGAASSSYGGAMSAGDAAATTVQIGFGDIHVNGSNAREVANQLADHVDQQLGARLVSSMRRALART